ncbi:MAG: helix-turn-helix domain-containing protein, partial [Sphingomonadaceae bacterium]
VRTLTRNFKATTGRTISKLAEDIRVRRAKAMLEDRSLPLKVVAHRTGFASASSFAVAFLRGTGQTPGSYRATVSRGRPY